MHTLSQAHAHTHNCTRVMRWLMPTHANRNMGKLHTHTHTHTHTKLPGANLQTSYLALNTSEQSLAPGTHQKGRKGQA